MSANCFCLSLQLPNPAANVRHTGKRFMPWLAAITSSKKHEEMHDDLSKIMWENVSQIGKEYLAESFPRLFWEQQMKAACVKDARAMR